MKCFKMRTNENKCEQNMKKPPNIFLKTRSLGNNCLFYPKLEKAVIDIVFIICLGYEILFQQTLYGRNNRTC